METVAVKYAQTTAFSLREKVVGRFWNLVNGSVFRMTPWFARGIRRSILRLFGAKISPTASIHQTVKIIHPWRLEMGDFASLGEGAIVTCYKPVTIRDYAIIGQHALIETGSHDIADPAFRFVSSPIEVGYGAWICARAVLLPGVTVGARAVVGAAAVCRTDVPDSVVVVGNPAVALKRRILKS